MYSRSFSNGCAEAPRPPENYNGTVFLESADKVTEPRENATEGCISDYRDTKQDTKDRDGIFPGLVGSPVLKAMLSRLGLPHLSLPRIGTEEILLIAAFAYLFFSKEGDKECAIILLLLLFVN